MASYASFATALRTLRDQPILFLGGLPIAFLGQVAVLLQVGYLTDSAALLVGLLLSLPFVLAGLVGMANDAREGTASIGGFLNAGLRNYLSVLGVLVSSALVLGFAAFVMVFLGSILAAFTTASGGGGASAVFGLSLNLLTLATLVVLLSICLHLQFVVAAVVVSDGGVIGALFDSVDRVGANLASVVGFTTLFLLVSFLLRVPHRILYQRATETVSGGFGEADQLVVASESTLWLSVGVGLVLGTVAVTVAWTYYTVYYRSLVS